MMSMISLTLSSASTKNAASRLSQSSLRAGVFGLSRAKIKPSSAIMRPARAWSRVKPGKLVPPWAALQLYFVSGLSQLACCTLLT